MKLAETPYAAGRIPGQGISTEISMVKPGQEAAVPSAGYPINLIFMKLKAGIKVIEAKIIRGTQCVNTEKTPMKSRV